MAFDVEVQRATGKGIAYRMDVSFDDWATIAHRWIDRDGLWGHNCLEELSTQAPYDYASLWTADNVALTAGQLAPDGSTRATRVVDDTANDEHRVFISCPLANERGMRGSTAYRYFAVARADTLSWLAIRDAGGTHAANFNLSTGATGTCSSGLVPRMVALGGGWWLCYIDFTAPAGGSQYVTLNVATADTGTSYPAPSYVGSAQGLYLHEAGACQVVTNSPRIASLGGLSRGFGEDHIASPGSFGLVLANEDGGLDSLFTDWATTLKLRARLYIGLYEPGSERAHWKQLSEYQLEDNPERDAKSVRLSLQDRLISFATFRTPSLKDWYEQDDYCPYHWVAQEELEELMANETWTRPLPLAFGHTPVQLTLATGIVGASGNNSGIGYTNENLFTGQAGWVLCATLNDEEPFPENDGQCSVYVEMQEVAIPEAQSSLIGPWAVDELAAKASVVALPRVTKFEETEWITWFTWKAGPITIDGRDWYIHFVVVDSLGLATSLLNNQAGPSGSIVLRDDPYVDPASLVGEDTKLYYGDGVKIVQWTPTPRLERIYNETAVLMSKSSRAWMVGQKRLSHMSDETPGQVHPLDILEDLARYYTPIGNNIDSARMAIARTMLAHREAYFVTSSLYAFSASGMQQLSSFLASHDLDLFFTWEGKLAASASNETFDAATATLPHFYEHELAGISDAIPSREMRGAYCNRVRLLFQPHALLDSGVAMHHVSWENADAALDPYGGAFLGVPSKGPFDNPNAVIPTGQQVFERELEARWVPRKLLRLNPWEYRSLSSHVRTRIRFTAPLRALNLDLGDYFTVDWTRGGATVYEGTIFQVQSLTLNPEAASVDVEALWAGDLRLNRPYLLDTEELQARAKLTARDATLTYGSHSVTFDGGSLITEGITAGDILVLRVSETPPVWQRCRAYRVVEVESATSIEVISDDADYTWGLPSGTLVVASSAWRIFRGATTAHTAVSDAVNYPYGSAPYGKVANQADGGTYSDAGYAHILKE